VFAIGLTLLLMLTDRATIH